MKRRRSVHAAGLPHPRTRTRRSKAVQAFTESNTRGPVRFTPVLLGVQSCTLSCSFRFCPLLPPCAAPRKGSGGPQGLWGEADWQAGGTARNSPEEHNPDLILGFPQKEEEGVRERKGGLFLETLVCTTGASTLMTHGTLWALPSCPECRA